MTLLTETRQVSITWASWSFDVLTLEWFWHFSFVIVVNCYCECSCSYRKCWMNKCDVNTLKQTAIQPPSMMSLLYVSCFTFIINIFSWRRPRRRHKRWLMAINIYFYKSSGWAFTPKSPLAHREVTVQMKKFYILTPFKPAASRLNCSLPTPSES